MRPMEKTVETEMIRKRRMCTRSIKEALHCPEEYLGTVERNTEIKVVYPVLCALGWHPVKDIAFGFQINRHDCEKTARAANAADFVLRDGDRLCAVGEAKHWFALDKKTWGAGLKQLRRYQKALRAPRAFLSSGRRWIILDKNGDVLDTFDLNANNLGGVLSALKLVIGKGKIKGAPCCPEILKYGTCPGGKPN